jgi:hypothetical protein
MGGVGACGSSRLPLLLLLGVVAVIFPELLLLPVQGSLQRMRKQRQLQPPLWLLVPLAACRRARESGRVWGPTGASAERLYVATLLNWIEACVCCTGSHVQDGCFFGL